ncbi:MAG: ATP-binding protein [Magnetococcales bacterium]|nr:ATP-binding protein [Magnetococcales bacterium]
MSTPATYSHRGDEYQICIALHWIIRLLRGEEKIDFIQADSNGIPGQKDAVVVDDVVVVYQDQRKLYVQAKKNQPDHLEWRISDAVMQKELCKARDQLQSDSLASVEFYSQSPFGELNKLAEGIPMYPDHANFDLKAPATTLKKTFSELYTLWQLDSQLAFSLAHSLKYAIPRSMVQWDIINMDDLARLVPRAPDAMRILREMLTNHQSKIRDAKHTIYRQDVLDKLGQEGIYFTAHWNEQESLNLFNSASLIGRQWHRDVDGHSFQRQAVADLHEAIKNNTKIILLTDGPGSGKTCVLLDLVELLEQEATIHLLFIRGDAFEAARTENDLKERGLPDDIVGRCARLAENRQVVVIIDSLDVLSLQRDHGALTLFLGLMDRLKRIPKLSVVTACRLFDLVYHPRLRDRKWDKTITIGKLNWQEEVVPMLIKWNVDPETLPLELRDLLLVPQNLRLFHPLAQVAAVSVIRSAYQLNDLFLRHLVIEDPALEDDAMTALQNMAHGMMAQREKRLVMALWQGSHDAKQRLISKGILCDAGAETLAFTHQTLRDNLLVRGALKQGTDLDAFVSGLPPLPFVRPAIRAYVLHLATVHSSGLGRHVTKVLNDQSLPYHVRRLIAETLAEIEPGSTDWPWINRLCKNQPELFDWMFQKTRNDAWFRMLYDNLLPSLAERNDHDLWQSKLSSRLDVWMNHFPSECVALWLKMLDRESDGSWLVMNLSHSLDRFTQWHTQGCRTLLERLMNLKGSQDYVAGTAISRYVTATNQGDDLLWAFIYNNVKNFSSYSIKKGIKCQPHHFHDQDFLKNRLINSELLMDMVINTLEEGTGHLADSIGDVKETSWRNQHEENDTSHISDRSILLDSLENALFFHADSNTPWWQVNEVRLRTCRNLALRYFLILAYVRQPERYGVGIACQLMDEELMNISTIFYELGQLVNVSSHCVENDVMSAYQQAILELLDKEDDQSSCNAWGIRSYYNRLIWIPCIFRIPEVQTFLDQHVTFIGHILPDPEIFSWGGCVRPPVDLETFETLSFYSQIQLLRYYENIKRQSVFDRDFLIGGKEKMIEVLSNATSNNPMRYLPFLSEEGLEKGYVQSIVDGVAAHIQYRFGNLSSNDWKPVKPLPDGEPLARHLLDLLEQNKEWLMNGTTGTRVMEACANVLMMSEDVERLTAQLVASIQNPDPMEELDDAGLRSQSINSARGIAAGAAARLAAKLLEAGQTLPVELVPLLKRFAGDPIPAVRIGLLDNLPVIIHFQQELGRHLFDIIFQEQQGSLWDASEQVFYYNYHSHYSWVEPRLERMFQEVQDESADSWSRIAALATLTGHMTLETLFEHLRVKNSDHAWKGAVQVFRANLDKHKALCVSGLEEIMRWDTLSDVLFSELIQMFSNKKLHPYIPVQLGQQFINHIASTGVRCNLGFFFEWIAFLAEQDSLRALELCEQLVEHLSSLKCLSHIWDTDDLFVAWTSILREADETNDEKLMHRIVALQDRFLQMGIYKTDEWLQKAEYF